MPIADRVSTVFLCGPMTGLPEFNVPAFMAAASRLRDEGLMVMNPAEDNIEPGSQPWHFYLRRSLGLLLASDAIAVLPGWESSRGALLELTVAKQLQMPLYDVETLQALELSLHIDTKPPALEPTPPAPSFAEATPNLVSLLSGEPEVEAEEPEAPWALALESDALLEGAEAQGNIFDSAKTLVYGERRLSYGHPYTHHSCTAAMWTAILIRMGLLRADQALPVTIVPAFYICDKVTRLTHTFHGDGPQDIAGYAECWRLDHGAEVRVQHGLPAY